MPFDGYALELMTHSEGPWEDARRGIEPDARSSAVIDEERMRVFYAEKISNNKTNELTKIQ